MSNSIAGPAERPRPAPPWGLGHALPPAALVLWSLASTLLGLTLLLAVLAAAVGQPLGLGWLHGLTLASGGLLAWLPWWQLQGLNQARQVVLGRALPQAALTHAWFQSMRTVGITALLLMAGSVALSLLPLRLGPAETRPGVLAAPGAMAMGLALAWWAAAAWQGLTAGPMRWAGLAVWVGAWLGSVWLPQAWAHWQGLPWPVHGLALAIPGWAMVAVGRKVVRPRWADDSAPSPRQRAAQLARRWREEVVPVDGAAGGFGIYVGQQWLIQGFFHDAGAWQRGWGLPLQPQSVLAMGMFSVWALSMQRWRGLHWRRMLAPGGLHRGHLGRSVVITTWLNLLLWVALLTVVGLLISTLVLQVSGLQAMWWRMGRYLPIMALELLLASAVAAWARARLPGPGWALAALLAGTVALGWAAWAWPAALSDAMPPALRQIGWAYLFLLLALALLFTALADRAWARMDLAALMEQRRRTLEREQRERP